MDSGQNGDKTPAESNTQGSKPWGKLVSINPNLSNVELNLEVYTIGRLETNDIPIDDIRISGLHCILRYIPSDKTVFLEDKSSNGTYIENQKIGKGNKRQLFPGKKFYILHKTKVLNQDQTKGFILTECEQKADCLKRERQDGKKEEDTTTGNAKQIKVPLNNSGNVSDAVKCQICKGCIYKCVTAIPCIHNFCASCYSDWMEKSSCCPECKSEVLEIKKNTFMDNIVSNFLQNNPRYRKTTKDLLELDAKNKIHDSRLVLHRDALKHKSAEKVSESQEQAENATYATSTGMGKIDLQLMEKKLSKYYELFHRFTVE